MISVFRSGRVPQPRAIDPIHLHVRVPPSGPPRPEPPEDSGGGIRLRSASGPVVTGAVGLAMAALAAVAVAAPAIDPEPDDKPAVVAAPLPQNLRHAVLLDPKVSEATARACQMAHRLGLARAEGRPKVSANITGSRQIVGRIKENRYGNVPNSWLTPSQREIKQSGAHTREFDHREKNNIYDGKVSLRHTFVDWGQRGNRTEARMLAHQAARIDALGVMRERSHELVRLSLLLRRAEEVIAVQKANFTAVSTEVEAVRALVEAGVGRMSDLREAQLVALDQEIAINRSEAERDQIREGLAAEFDLGDSDARLLVQVFLARRPAALAVLQADRSDKAHAFRLRAREVTHEAAEIRGSRYPKLDGVIEGTIFDMTDYEDEYEVVGKVEMTMPLYDGGTAKARLRETA